MVIDFSDKILLKETYTEMLGSWSKTLLKWMYGDDVKMVANLNEDDDLLGFCHTKSASILKKHLPPLPWGSAPRT